MPAWMSEVSERNARYVSCLQTNTECALWSRRQEDRNLYKQSDLPAILIRNQDCSLLCFDYSLSFTYRNPSDGALGARSDARCATRALQP